MLNHTHTPEAAFSTGSHACTCGCYRAIGRRNEMGDTHVLLHAVIHTPWKRETERVRVRERASDVPKKGLKGTEEDE